jgi:hypothetical protein
LANGNGPKKLYDQYYVVLTQMNKDLATRTTKTEAQEDNWLTPAEIEKVFEQLDSEVKKFKVAHITKKDFTTALSLIVLSLFTKTPPRRNVDYTLMKISNDMTDTKYNYFDIQKKQFIFNNYKTQKKYKQVVIDIPNDLGEVIAKYMKFHPERNKIKNKNHDIYFLVNHNGDNLTNSNDITKILNTAVGQKIDSSMLRNMYLTHKYGDAIDELKEDTAAMGTSVGVAMNHYIKVDD